MRFARHQARVSLMLMASAAAILAAPRIPQDSASLNNDLIEAVRAGNIPAMRSALNHGADPNVKDSTGNPALMLAALYSNARAMTLLLDRGADANAQNAARATALHWSAGDPAKAFTLLTHGAFVNVKSAAGRTPLAIAAAQDGNFEIVKMMVEHGAPIDEHDNLEGFLFTGGGSATPLIEAAKTRDIRAVRYLLDHGANVNAVDHMGATALTEASLRGSTEIVRLLIERGANVKAHVKGFDATPLIFAAMRGSSPVIELLLKSGADVEAKDASGSTALMWAAYSDKAATASVERLIAAGANIKAKNKFGETPMTWAARRGATPVVALLRSAGATTSEAPTSALSQPASQPFELREAVARSLQVLDKGGPQFFKVSGCVSCHNQTLPLMASKLARSINVQPDENIEKQQMKAMLAFVKPATGILAENTDVVPDVPLSGSYILMALAAQNYSPDLTTASIVHNIAARQLKDGSWFGWAPRPPIEAGDIQATALSIRSLQLYGPSGRKAEFDARIARARDWLRRAHAATTEEKTMRVFGLAWAGAGRDDIGSAAQTLLKNQRSDGGWGQLDTVESDAYATGKVLVALHEAGNISVMAPAYRRGADYLLSTQHEDGSWLVKTRSFPFQPLKDSGFPHGRDQWISAAGTSWAAMALIYSAPSMEMARR